MEARVITSKHNVNMKFVSESEINEQTDHMIGYILRNMYDKFKKNYSYEEVKNILQLKNNFQQRYKK